MKWGHKVSSNNETLEVTRAEYNAAFGVEVPEEPEIPLDHVWIWFWTLNRRRQSGGDGLNPLTYQEVYSWSALTRTIVTPSEVELLMEMDNAFIEQVSIERKAKAEREQANQPGRKRR